ncbi:MAG: hypothetical protein R2705_03910 [Ilumatobacteraceae bacterium]
MSGNGQDGFFDHESSKPEARPRSSSPSSTGSTPDQVLIVIYGWTMAEDLVKLGAR